MNERWEAFDRIWAKGKTNKMVQRLMDKCKLRGLEPTRKTVVTIGWDTSDIMSMVGQDRVIM